MSKKTSVLSNVKTFLQAIWNFFKGLLFSIYTVVEKFLIVLEHIIRQIFNLLKIILKGVSMLIASIALLIAAIGLTIFLIGKTVGLNESPAFQESREFWITFASLENEQELQKEFLKHEDKDLENEPFTGDLPSIGPIDETQKNTIRTFLRHND